MKYSCQMEMNFCMTLHQQIICVIRELRSIYSCYGLCDIEYALFFNDFHCLYIIIHYAMFHDCLLLILIFDLVLFCWFLICTQLPIAALNSLCALIHDFLLPSNNIFPRSWFLFRKEFNSAIHSTWSRVDICIKEHHIFEFGETTCPICGEDRYVIKKLKKGNKSVPRKWFYSMSFIDRIKRRFEKDKEWVEVCIFTLSVQNFHTYVVVVLLLHINNIMQYKKISNKQLHIGYQVSS